MRQRISACMIVRDEAAVLPDALASVAFCDEVIVVDSGSSDATLAIARAAGARVVESPWRGYGAQRNVAIDNASCEWIIEVDADERISPGLRREIESFLEAPPDGVDMGALPIRNMFLGAPLASSARYPGYRYRLFRRGAYRHDEARTVHEGLWSNGPVWAFEHDLSHLLASSWREALTDLRTYARLEARQVRLARTPPAAASALVARPLAKFGYRAFVLGGWRDGWRGFSKIILDCGTDVAVSALALRDGAGPRGSADGGHYFSDDPGRRGPVRVVGLAHRSEATAAADWLERAHALGADVSLVTDGDSPTGVRSHRVSRISPLLVIRALDAENQLRGYDALLLCGWQAKLCFRILAPSLRGRHTPLAPGVDPAEAVERVRAATRA